jgi:hypothetical protein
MKILKRLFWLIIAIPAFFVIPIAIAIWGTEFVNGAFDYIFRKLK